MRIMVIGSRGQLGTAVVRLGAKTDHDWILPESLSGKSAEQIADLVRSARPQAVINCAAFTDVRGAETMTGRAIALNRDLPETLALICKEIGAWFATVSTDYVFDGSSSTPYGEGAETHPLNVYGATKEAGERAVLAANPDACILRTSWLYSAHGGFVRKIRNLSFSDDPIRVVDWQTGTPTHAADLARSIVLYALPERLRGIYHYSAEGCATWYDFAMAINRLENLACEMLPTKSTADSVIRPAYTVLDKTRIKSATMIQIPHWFDSLSECLHG